MTMLKKAIAISMGIFFGLVVCEIFLRIFDPLPFRVKGDKIMLPVHQEYRFSNTAFSKLDSIIVHSKNSLGFRGPEKPQNFDDALTFIAVGGSTTECQILSDGHDWVNLLGNHLKKQLPNTWVNNAGLDGHSTFGHYILLTDYLLDIHPDYILYLVGCNEVGRDDLGSFDKKILRDEYVSFRNWFKKNSELGGFLSNIYRGYLAKKKNLPHRQVDLEKQDHVSVDSTYLKAQLHFHQPFLSAFEFRLTELVRTTRKAGIQPVLITQPTLLGAGYDELSGVNLETIKLMSEFGGWMYWSILERYNDITRQVARNEGILLIDLAYQLPKNSLYYYDALHYTNEGAKEVSMIVFESLAPFVKRHTISNR